ncbi:MAG: hypothetical protein ACRDKT_00740 [Actinomycetota bacterium]
MSARGKTFLTVGVAGFALALVVLYVVGFESKTPSPDGGVFGLIMIVLALVFVTAGMTLVRRLPRNPVGWSFVAIGLVLVEGIALSDYAFRSYTGDEALPGALAAAWLSDVTFNSVLVLAPFASFFLFFPTGRLPSRRWRPVLILGAIGVSLLLVDTALRPEELTTVPVMNPLALEAIRPFRPFLQLAMVPFAIAVLASGLSLALRFRRARGVERQQIKWALAAGALFAAVWASAPLFFWRVETATWIWPTLLFGSLALIPISAAIAIFRYRLYEIDVVINRTLVYGTLTTLLATTYIATVFALQAVLSPFTQQSDLAIAGSTLAVAALFRPLRRSVQAFIDRRFYRRRFDAQATLETFGTHVRDQVDLDALRASLVAAVTETMQPVHVSLWLRGPVASRTFSSPTAAP